jgi:hypothetical protein
MDLNKVVADLIRERDLLDEAIAHLERLAAGTPGSPSRPQRASRPEKRAEKVRTAGSSFD